MTRLRDRKTRCILVTEATARYRGRERAIIVEPHPAGELVQLRLHGSRIRYEVSWRGIFDFAGRVIAERARNEKKSRRQRHDYRA